MMGFQRRLVLFTSSAVVVAVLATASAVPARGLDVGGAVDDPATDTFVPDRVLVGFEPGANRDAIAETVDPQGRAALGLPRVEVWQVDQPAEVVSQLADHPGVAYAERDRQVELLREPNDTLWVSQEGAKTVEAPQAWNTETGDDDVVIAVLDTGVDLEHEDVGSLVDGTNVVETIIESLGQSARDVLNRQSTDDLHGHGTSSASVAAAPGDNGRGVAGLCWACSVMPVKVLSDAGSGRMSDLAAGVTWAADHGADVIAMSLGGTGSTRTIEKAVAHAREQGALLVAAAGNAGISEPFYPAALDGVLSVGASDPLDNRLPFSNYGDWVDVAAPGCNPAAKPEDLYTPAFCGTSSAAPVVAGIAGLGFSVDPSATAEEVRSAITTTAVDVGDWVAHGRVDAAGTVTTLQESSPPADSGDTTQDGSTDSDAPTEEGAAEGGDSTADEDTTSDGEAPAKPRPPACPEGGVPPTDFEDTAGNPHADNIACVAWYGITQGTSADTYAPAAPVRRDQMATFLVRLLEVSDVQLPPAERQGFTDLHGNPHAERVRQLAAVGITQGTSADTYSPAAPVRRDQMATFLVRTYEHIDGEPLPKSPTGFVDIAGNPHRPNIAKAAAAGFAQGTTTETYSPAAPVRRDQMATFLARTLEQAVQDGHVTPPAS